MHRNVMNCPPQAVNADFYEIFENLNLEFVSDFEIRVSNLLPIFRL